MTAPACAQCGASGWDITIGGTPGAPLTLHQIHATYSEDVYFCDTLCLLRWAVEQRESVVRFWRRSWEQSAADINHVLRASLLERVRIGRWWSKRVEQRSAS